MAGQGSLGLQQSYGAQAARQAFRDMIASELAAEDRRRKIEQEQFENQQKAEATRLARDRYGLDTSKFGLETTKYTDESPKRAADLAYVNAQTGKLTQETGFAQSDRDRLMKGISMLPDEGAMSPRKLADLSAASDFKLKPTDLVPKPQNQTDYGDFLARYAGSIGKKIEQLTPADEVAARKLWGQADDQPRQMVPIVVAGPQGPVIVDRGSGTGRPVTMGDTKETVGRPLSGSEVEKVAGGEQGIDVIGRLRRLKTENPWIDQNLGPLAGRWAEAQQFIPGTKVPPPMASFIADTAILRNATIKAITGAQMSEPEARRIRQQIPEITDKPEVWEAKAAATEQNLAAMNARIKSLRGQSQTPGATAQPGAADDPLGIRRRGGE